MLLFMYTITVKGVNGKKYCEKVITDWQMGKYKIRIIRNKDILKKDKQIKIRKIEIANLRNKCFRKMSKYLTKNTENEYTDLQKHKKDQYIQRIHNEKTKQAIIKNTYRL